MQQNKSYLVCILATVFVVAAAGSAFAQSAVNSIEVQLLQCISRVTDTARLACYDGLAESLRSAAPQEETSSIPPVPAEADPVQAAPKPTVDATTAVPVIAQEQVSAPQKAESFDTDVQQKQSIRVMIEKTKRNSRGDWYFYFDNDEVWKQIDTRNRRIPPLPAAATVSRGLFSSHKLHIDGEVWAMKIRRVK